MSVVLSCIMPVYNAAPYLESAIQSVTSQSWPYFELLLIDDGSTDGSALVCDAAARRDQRVRVIHQANKGVAAARNTGLALASGRILCFADADDRMKPGAFARIVPAMEDRKRDLVSFGYDFARPDGCGTAFYESFACTDWSQLWPHFIGYYQAGLFSSLCNKAYRTSLIRKAGLRFDRALRCGEDIGFNLAYWSLAASFEHFGEPLYEFICRPESLTCRPLLDYMDTSRRALYLVKNFLYQHGQQQLYSLLASAQLPWCSARFFDQLTDPGQPYDLTQRQTALDKLFSDELWQAALLTELARREGYSARFFCFAVRRRSSFLATLPLRLHL